MSCWVRKLAVAHWCLLQHYSSLYSLRRLLLYQPVVYNISDKVTSQQWPVHARDWQLNYPLGVRPSGVLVVFKKGHKHDDGKKSPTVLLRQMMALSVTCSAMISNLQPYSILSVFFPFLSTSQTKVILWGNKGNFSRDQRIIWGIF